MIDWPTVQARLKVKPDGQPGPVTFTALLSAISGREIDKPIPLALSMNAVPYALTTPERLAGFIGQCCHESAGFTRMEEMGGAAYFTRLYEGRQDLGNTQPGDGARYHGRGLIQLTGRINYRRIGADLGLDLEGNPELAETPGIAVLTALQFWRRNRLNDPCDSQDWRALTRKINGGLNGIAERVRLITDALELLA